MGLRLVLFILIGSCLGFAPAKAMVAPSKKDILGQLSALQKANQDQLAKLDGQLSEQLKKARKIQLTSDSDAAFVAEVPGALKELKSKQREFKLRRDFIDRLLFQIDTKWNGVDLKGFLEVTLLNMAATDLRDENGRASDASFATYLSMAVRELPERDENLVNFVESYMQFSTVSNPRPPQEFLQARSYMNGAHTYSAQVVKREDVGDLVDARIQSLSPQKPTPKKKPKVIKTGFSAL